MNKRRCVMLTLTLAGLAFSTAVGCESPQSRVPVSETTPEEERFKKVQPATLIEFSDQVPAALTQALADIPEIRNAPHKATIILGDLNNKTGNVSSNEFELVQRRIRNTLLQSQFARDNMQWVESRARMAQIAAREAVGSSPEEAGPPAYDPQTTFVLNGDFFRIERGRINEYYMEFKLVHFQTNVIVFADRLDAKQQRITD